MRAAEIRRRRPELLELVGLTGRDRESVAGYSKGMQQRLGLAQAMLHRPELIILDEPTDGVDPVGRKDIREVLKRLAAAGHSIFLNSHLLQEIELVCDRVAIMTNGTVRQTGSVPEVKKRIADAPIVLQLDGPAAAIASVLQTAPPHTVTAAPPESDWTVVEFRGLEQPRLDAMIDALRQQQVSIRAVTRREFTLEEAFLQIVDDHA